MTTSKPIRPMFSGLSEEQWKSTVNHIEYLFDTNDEYFLTYEKTVNFIDDLECWSLITPNDRDTLRKYAMDLRIEGVEILTSRNRMSFSRIGGAK